MSYFNLAQIQYVCLLLTFESQAEAFNLTSFRRESAAALLPLALKLMPKCYLDLLAVDLKH
jgi:hypothetical protein